MSPSAQNIEETISHAHTAAVPAWKQELNERLAATRSRRLRQLPEQVSLPGLEAIRHKADSRASRLAAKVAQRYANAPSYSEVLAAEMHARARAAALENTKSESARVAAPVQPAPVASPNREDFRETEKLTASIAARMDHTEFSPDEEGKEELEEERTVEPLAVNLIEFPRELVAPRKMRPQLAEGPLREATPAETVSRSVSVGPAPANWAPIRLDENPIEPLLPRGTVPAQQTPLKTATIEDRVMAAVFDFALVVAAFAIFVLVFVACTAHPPAGKPALLAAGLVLAGFGLLYQYLFFRFAEGTPGMRYAKIALCTFEDESPTRRAMCRRVVLLLLSAAPLGLGFVWACFDQDRLSWHDRISRIYQRSYS